jgi:tetratricopeptide (TPR) repeat protein
MKKFSSSLVEEGYLLLGASDPVVIDDTNLMLQVEHGKLLCRRSATSAPANKVINKVYSNDPAQPIPTIAPKRTVAPAIFIPKVDDKPDALLAKAEALANQGLLSEAAKCCEQGLRVDPINLTTYFTYAMVLVGLNEVDKAEAALRKTLFLDRDFVLGHYQLGLMLIRKKDLIGGLKSLQNAYAITEKKDATIPVPGYENLTYGKLTDILQEEIQLREVGSDAHETE